MAQGKRMKTAREGIDTMNMYPVEDAVKMVKERAKAKFDETIEIAINLNVDPRHCASRSLPRAKRRRRLRPRAPTSSARKIWRRK